MNQGVELSSDEALHALRVRTSLAQAIVAAGGWLSFEHYMQLALYAPGLGYYSAGARKFGYEGDFTTAPETSRLFGACIARQCRELLGAISGGSILELGAGTGRLAVDILARMEALGRLPDEYLILEVSADLRDRQQRLLGRFMPHLAERVRWLDGPLEQPFDGVIIANEVLDSLPVQRFRWRGVDCVELGVVNTHNGFAWSERTAGAVLTQRCRALNFASGGWDVGYVSEWCPRLGPWTRSIVGCLRRGAALWFDYGLPRRQYYLPERHGGTLICHFRQRANEDPFINPGLQDISAWVDFTALAEACEAARCEMSGFSTQAFFLAGLQIDEEMRAIARDDEHLFARLANEAKQLMLPGAMGESFKVMAWTRGIALELAGFALQDLRHTL